MIRRAQLEVFAQAARAGFVERMAEHLRSIFTDECAALGAGLNEWIDAGITRAAKHGIEIEDDVARYLALRVAFGADFEQEPWARAVLEDAAIDDPSKAHLLYEAALEHARNLESQ